MSGAGPGQYASNVPTMDEFNALAAKVDKNTADIASLNTRVTKLESGGTQPPKTPSADGTTVTNTTGSIIDKYSRTFRLTGAASNYQIDCDGATTGGAVVQLYAKNGFCHQKNAYNDWWCADKTGAVDSSDDWTACPDPTGTVPPQPSGDVPAPAKAVGYNTQTLGPKLVIGKPWINQTGVKLTTLSDGSVLLEHGGAPYNYNADLSTTKMLGGGNFSGPAYGGGGYFEAVLSLANPPTTTDGGWPAWWSNDVECQSGNKAACRVGPWGSNRGIWFEPDFMEHMSPNDYGAANHHWYGDVDTYQGGDEQPLNAHKNLSGIDISKPHKYGYLWVPAVRGQANSGRIEVYFDDAKIGGYTYNYFDYNNPPPYPPSGTNCTGALDTRHIYLMLGTGPKNNMTIHSASVWQKSAAANDVRP